LKGISKTHGVSNVRPLSDPSHLPYDRRLFEDRSGFAHTLYEDSLLAKDWWINHRIAIDRLLWVINRVRG
jgi:hypothetical protein